jgi:ribonuclease P/MRP protein subunit RPP40
MQENIKLTKKLLNTNKQYGFLPGRSTMDAIILVLEDLERAKDDERTAHALFFDFEKPFDLVIHLIHLLKLYKLLSKWITTWIAEYLFGRKQRAKANGTVSEWKNVEAGVIQGSVLGPVLFLLFIADINSYLPETTNLQKIRR